MKSTFLFNISVAVLTLGYSVVTEAAPLNLTQDIQDCQDIPEAHLRRWLVDLNLRDVQFAGSGDSGEESNGSALTELAPPTAQVVECATSSTGGCSRRPIPSEVRPSGNSRFVCPWEPVWLPEDITMYPSKMTSVRCLCNECRHRFHMGSGSCNMITRRVHVLKWAGCQDGRKVYAPDTVEVGVACACSYKNTWQTVVPARAD